MPRNRRGGGAAAGPAQVPRQPSRRRRPVPQVSDSEDDIQDDQRAANAAAARNRAPRGDRRQRRGPANPAANTSCPICMGEAVDVAPVNYLPCGHWLCRGCWFTGLQSDAVGQRVLETCPLCRAPTGFRSTLAGVETVRAIAGADSIATSPLRPLTPGTAAAAIGRTAIPGFPDDAAEALAIAPFSLVQRAEALALAHRFNIERLPPVATVAAGMFPWRARETDLGYLPGAFVNLVTDGGNPHAVLHAQRRAAYMLIDSFAATAPADCVFVDVGGRPDIVETLPNASRRWAYMCPLLMQEDYDRSLENEIYMGTVACRCRIGMANGRLLAPCQICGPETRVLVFMHSAYYIPMTQLVALAQEGTLVLCVHRFDGFSGQFAYKRGTSSPREEATWTRSGDTVRMKVNGNAYTYEHSSMAWLRSNSSITCHTGSAMWRRVTSLGDYSVNADPMVPTAACLDIYVMERCEPEVVQASITFGPRVRHASHRVEGTDGVVYEYYKEGPAMQIVASEDGHSRVLTISYEGFEEVARKFPGQPPAAAMTSALQRARAYCAAGDIAFLCRAAQAYSRQDTELLAEAMVIQRPRDDAIAAAFRGQPANPDRLDINWRLGCMVTALSLTGSPLVAIAGLGVGSWVRSFYEDIAKDGVLVACRRRQISPLAAAALGALLGLILAWHARRLFERVSRACSRGPRLLLGTATTSGWLGFTSEELQRRQRAAFDWAQSNIQRAVGVLRVAIRPPEDSGAIGWRERLNDTVEAIRERVAQAAPDMRERVGNAAIVTRGHDFWVELRDRSERAVMAFRLSPDYDSGVAAALRTLFGSLGLLFTRAHPIVASVASGSITITDELLREEYAKLLAGPSYVITYNIVRNLPGIVASCSLATRLPWFAVAMLPALVSMLGPVAVMTVIRDVLIEEVFKGRMGRVCIQTGTHKEYAHVAFATVELLLKLCILKTDDYIGVLMPWCMHVALARRSFIERVCGHSVWNLAVAAHAFMALPLEVRKAVWGGSLVSAVGERYRAVIQVGLGGYATLAFGNHVWGQAHEGMTAPANPTLKEGAWVRSPRPFAPLLMMPKPLMVVGPIISPCELGVPVSYAWNAGVEQWCLEGRHCMETPSPDPAALERFALFSKRFNSAIYRRMRVDAVPFEEWLRDFPPARRVQLERARVEWMRDPFVAVNHDVARLGERPKRYEATLRSFFIKVEQTAPGKTPRGIQALRDVALVPAGPWFKALPRALAKCANGTRMCDGVFVVYGLSRTKSEAMRIAMHLAIEGRPVVLVCGDDGWVATRGRAYSLDAKRWDAHTGRRLLQIGNATWKDMGCPRTGSRLLESGLKRHGYSRAGLEYCVDGTTGSGDLDTITKNTDIDAKIITRAVILSERTGRPFVECLIEVALALGIEYEFVSDLGEPLGDVVRLYNVEFCSALPVLLEDGTWGMSPKLGRVLYRFGLCLTGHPPEQMLRAKCLSLLADAKHSTLCTLFARCMLARVGPGKVAPFSKLRRFGTLTNSEVGPDRDFESAAIVMRYGFSMEVLADRLVAACMVPAHDVCVHCPVLAAVVAVDI